MKFILLLLSVVACLYTQAKDYTFYYRQTQLAEECALNEQFELSLTHYDSAFKAYEFKFARDCYIAAQIAAYLSRDEDTYRYLEYTVVAGVPLKCITGKKIFDRFWRTELSGQFKNSEPQYRQLYLSRIDTALNREMTTRFDKEQKIKSGEKEVYFDVVDDNIIWIKKLLDENHLPMERVVGIKNSVVMCQTRSMSTCSFSSDMAIATLKHYNYTYEYLWPQLVKAMHEGYINAREMVSIYIFNKHKVCIRSNRKHMKSPMWKDIAQKDDLTFNLPFEKVKTDTATANRNRNQWFIPRMGMKHNTFSLLKSTGINLQIGEWTW